MIVPKAVKERRRSIRIEEKLPFKIGHGEFAVEAVTVNLSVHGALCSIEEDFPLMTQLKVALSLPDYLTGGRRSKTILLKGVVVRKEKSLQGKHFLIAIYFSDIKPPDLRYLQKFIESRSSAGA